MVRRYAQGTTVSVERSKIEIERLVTKWGGGNYLIGSFDGRQAVLFAMQGRTIRMVVNTPDKNERRFTHTPGRDHERTSEDAHKEWERACRQAWRSLLLQLKAKFEAIADEVADIDDEFMAYYVLPDGKTFGEHMKPKLAKAFEQNKMPQLALPIGSPDG